MAAAQENRINFMEFMGKLRSGDMRIDECPEEAVVAMERMFKTSRDKLQLRFDSGLAREQQSPKPGLPAPDFNLERLDAKGKQTGEFVHVGVQMDKPVALVFGSYT